MRNSRFDDLAFPGGMSLRDWFAGQIVAGMRANVNFHNDRENLIRGIAVDAYELADAMLREREMICLFKDQTGACVGRVSSLYYRPKF